MDIIQEFEKKQVKRKIPLIKPGDTIKIHQKIQEGDKERIQIFEGVVIKIRRGYGINGNITVRKISSGIGVEKTFPFHLPSIVKMEVIKRGKVRRAKLYYLRRLQEKAAKLKDKKLSDKKRSTLIFDSTEAKKNDRVEEKSEESEDKSKKDKKSEPQAHEIKKQPILESTKDKKSHKAEKE